jgi:hypothetical protein
MLAVMAAAIWQWRALKAQRQNMRAGAEANERLRRQIEQEEAAGPRLRAEKRVLREIESLRKAAGDLPRLEQEAERLRKGLAEAQTNAAVRAAAADRTVLPKEGWTDRGSGSPEASLETLAWAMRDGLVDRIRELVRLASPEVDPGVSFAPGKVEELEQALGVVVTNLPQAMAYMDEIRIRDIRQDSTNRATVLIAERPDPSSAEGNAGRSTIIRPVEFRLIDGEWRLYLDNTNRWPIRRY